MPSGWGCWVLRTAPQFPSIFGEHSRLPWISPRHDRHVAQAQTGEIKVLQQVWRGCLFGSFILGIPLYRRACRSAMVAFNVVALLAAQVPTEEGAALYAWMSVIGLGLYAFFGMRANQMAIERHLGLGWEFADPRRGLI